MPKVFYLLLAFFGFLAGEIPESITPAGPESPFPDYTETAFVEGYVQGCAHPGRISVFEKDCGKLRCVRLAFFLNAGSSYTLAGRLEKPFTRIPGRPPYTIQPLPGTKNLFRVEFPGQEQRPEAARLLVSYDKIRDVFHLKQLSAKGFIYPGF